MKEMNKKNYMSPMVEILNARVEKGFQASGETPNPDVNTGLQPEVPGEGGEENEISVQMFD